MPVFLDIVNEVFEFLSVVKRHAFFDLKNGFANLVLRLIDPEFFHQSSSKLLVNLWAVRLFYFLIPCHCFLFGLFFDEPFNDAICL